MNRFVSAFQKAGGEFNPKDLKDKANSSFKLLLTLGGLGFVALGVSKSLVTGNIMFCPNILFFNCFSTTWA